MKQYKVVVQLAEARRHFLNAELLEMPLDLKRSEMHELLDEWLDEIEDELEYEIDEDDV